MKIVDKKIIGQFKDARIVQLKIEALDIAQKAKPGQFVVLMVNDRGERFPLTIVDKNKGTIDLIVQEIGLTTKLLGKLKAGDSLYALAGPLGQATEIKNYGKVILVGGGVGIAEIFPIAKALKKAGNYLLVIIGARTKGLLILEKELKEVSDELYISTDDGSYGKKSLTTEILDEVLAKQTYDFVYSVGPLAMMRKVAEKTKKEGINTKVSLNALMVDGTGMCGSCRVSLAGKTKFTCIDGPEFNAHEIDWPELEARNKMYVISEKHICKLKGYE